MQRADTGAVGRALAVAVAETVAGAGPLAVHAHRVTDLERYVQACTALDSLPSAVHARIDGARAGNTRSHSGMPGRCARREAGPVPPPSWLARCLTVRPAPASLTLVRPGSAIDRTIVAHDQAQPDHRRREGRQERRHAARHRPAPRCPKPPLLSGISRSYQPRDDEGDQLPPESTGSRSSRGRARRAGEISDAPVRRDPDQGHATCPAAAPTWRSTPRPPLPTVPVTYLLFLEKQLADVHRVVAKLPLLDPAEDWSSRTRVGLPEDPPGRDGPLQEDPPQPRAGQGDEGAPGPGAGLHGGRAGRRLDDGQVLPVPSPLPGAGNCDRVTALQGGEVRPRGANCTEVTDGTGQCRFRYLLAE